MKKSILIGMAVLLVLSSIFLVGSVTAARAKGTPTLLEFDTMVGVPKAYTGALSPIRGIPGGGLPWVVGSAMGELKADGRVEVKVTGLVLDPNDPTVISRGLAGQNPIANFMVIVSCQAVDANGVATVANLHSPLFPATTGPVSLGGGDASFEGTLALPYPCIAPILFVTSPGGSWFAATGN